MESLSYGTLVCRNRCSDSQMQTQLYYPDGESIGNADPVAVTHMFLRKRYILTQKSRAFDLEGPLYENFFFLSRQVSNQRCGHSVQTVLI